MNCRPFMWSMSAQSGCQKSLMFASMIGLRWRPSLNPGDLLDHFLKCSYSTRHRNECIRHFEHLALSFMHVAGNDQVVITPHCMFARDQKLGMIPVTVPP